MTLRINGLVVVRVFCQATNIKFWMALGLGLSITSCIAKGANIRSKLYQFFWSLNTMCPFNKHCGYWFGLRKLISSKQTITILVVITSCGQSPDSSWASCSSRFDKRGLIWYTFAWAWLPSSLPRLRLGGLNGNFKFGYYATCWNRENQLITKCI